jgi:hypothetical protein
MKRCISQAAAELMVRHEAENEKGPSLHTCPVEASSHKVAQHKSFDSLGSIPCQHIQAAMNPSKS